MEFDTLKVYTAVNADEVKVGSRGYSADSLCDLKKLVNDDHKSVQQVLKKIQGENTVYRFIIGNTSRALFYLVEEPKEKKFRPYKDTDEMIEDFKERYSGEIPFYAVPLIWVRHKETKSVAVVTSFSKVNNAVTFANADIPHSLGILLEQFTYLDGSPCGIEE